MKSRSHLRALAVGVAAAGLMTALAGLGVLKSADLSLSDRLYQTPSASDGEIVLIGIDQRAIEELGPYSQWGRDVIAAVIETLNQSPDCHPAAIGVDILYAGESDPDLDAYLAEAAGEYGNVVTACAAQFGSALVSDDAGGYDLDSFSITAFEQPYAALQEATRQGHINAMLDTDGIFRHAMLHLTLPDGSQIPSMALQLAQQYRDYTGGESISLPPTDAHGFWYLPFCGEPGDLSEDISVIDVLTGEIDAGYFADRIVLIGPYTTGLQDSFLTAADHARPMYGVECQANAVQALLWGTYKTEVRDALQLALLFVFLLGCFMLFRRRSVKVSTPIWLGLCALWVFICKVAYSQGYILHVLWVPVGVTLVYAGWLATNYIQATLEKRRITNTFKHYVDPAIIKELLREDVDALGMKGKMVDIAVLFVDIRGFTTMSELLTPLQVVEILDEYLTLTTKCVMDNHGTLDKYVGDCTMAFWNAPLPQEDYVMNACRAAMGMVLGSAPLAEKLQREFGRTVSFGVGVHVGPAVVGNIGSPMRKDYTAIGDTVNTSARLEANAPAGTVYISRAVADALEGRIRATPLETPIKLKGKAEGFEILTLDEILD